MVKHESILNEGLCLLNDFINNYSKILLDQEELKNKMNDYISYFNYIISSKQVEKYRIEYLFGKRSKLLSSINEILESWSRVRVYLGRYLYSGIYKRDDIIKSTTELSKLYIEEGHFVSTITSKRVEPIYKSKKV